MTLTLLPFPRQIQPMEGILPVSKIGRVKLEGRNQKALRKVAELFLARLNQRIHRDWIIHDAKQDGLPGDIILRIAPERVLEDQGYSLIIGINGIRIDGHDAAGVYYGLCTLSQILEQAGSDLDCMHILDWPDFPTRGVMFDISRDKVPTMQTLFSLVDLLSGWKINQLQLYIEHTFAYQGHEQVWGDASPLTGDEVRELDSFCLERHIELVPNQNSFGHMKRWLVHPAYAHLAEVVDGYIAPWGQENGPFSLCAVDPQSLAFVNSLYDELLPHFSSIKINVGCDETFDLGQGRSKDLCEQKGRGQVYLDYLLQVYSGIKQRGRTMMYWGDMLLEHPELISYLPKDAIALEWGYEADHPFADHCASLQAEGIPFYVCPGTSAWSSIAGRSDNALENLRNAAENGLRYGADGYLITDWGDNGHWQPLPVSFLGFAAGAAYSWSMQSNREIDIVNCLDIHAFHDRASKMGKVAYDLGNIYKAAEIAWANSSVFFSILQRPLELLSPHPKIHKIPFERVLEAIDRAVLPLACVDPDLSIDPGLQPELYSREFELAASLLRHACKRGILAVQAAAHGKSINGADLQNSGNLQEELFEDLQEIIPEYEEIWLRRNRQGGLTDSVGRLKKLIKDYRQKQ